MEIAAIGRGRVETRVGHPAQGGRAGARTWLTARGLPPGRRVEPCHPLGDAPRLVPHGAARGESPMPRPDIGPAVLQRPAPRVTPGPRPAARGLPPVAPLRPDRPAGGRLSRARGQGTALAHGIRTSPEVRSARPPTAAPLPTAAPSRAADPGPQTTGPADQFAVPGPRTTAPAEATAKTAATTKTEAIASRRPDADPRRPRHGATSPAAAPAPFPSRPKVPPPASGGPRWHELARTHRRRGSRKRSGSTKAKPNPPSATRTNPPAAPRTPTAHAPPPPTAHAPPPPPAARSDPHLPLPPAAAHAPKPPHQTTTAPSRSPASHPAVHGRRFHPTSCPP